MESFICGLLYLASIIQHIFEIHLCCYMNQYCILFHARIIVHLYIYKQNLFIHSAIDRCLNYFHIMNNTSVNICVQVSVWTQIFISSRYTPRSRIAESYGNCMFRLCRTAKLFSTTAALFTFLLAVYYCSSLQVRLGISLGVSTSKMVSASFSLTFPSNLTLHVTALYHLALEELQGRDSFTVQRRHSDCEYLCMYSSYCS